MKKTKEKEKIKIENKDTMNNYSGEYKKGKMKKK